MCRCICSYIHIYIYVDTYIHKYVDMLLWGRSALSCGFAMRKLFVPLPNMKPSTEGGTEHPRVT